MALAAFMLFGWLGTGDVSEWDEARNGANAWEMLRRGDPVNLWYAGAPDTWNAKPPLVIWLIAGSYEVFGYNERALRIPSAVCGLLFFSAFFALVRRMANEKVAAISCVILFCCKAVISHHVFRTGDFDGPLVAFVTAALYFFIRSLEDKTRWALPAAGAMLGLAFLTKGPVAFILVPGMVGYTAVRRELTRVVRSSAMWTGVAIVGGVVAAWFIAVARWGHHSQESFYGTANSVETTFIHDVWRRITEKNFSGEWHHDPFFFLLNLEARMNLWHIAFYAATAVGVWRISMERKRLIAFTRRPENRLALLCVCLVLPVAMLLTAAQGAHDWYTAPVLPFVAVLVALFTQWTVARWKPARWIWFGLALFTGARHLHYLVTPERRLGELFSRADSAAATDAVLVVSPPRQHLYLYSLWRGRRLEVVRQEELTQLHGQFVLVGNDELRALEESMVEVLSASKDYTLVWVK